jgi:hypothetical protein
MKDQRHNPRYCLHWPATLLLGETSSGVMVGGRVHDLSLGGASVLSDLYVRDIEQLTLILLPPPLHPGQERKIITVESQLVYSVHSNEHGCFRAGLRFVRFEGGGRRLLEERLGQHSPVFEGA